MRHNARHTFHTSEQKDCNMRTIYIINQGDYEERRAVGYVATEKEAIEACSLPIWHDHFTPSYEAVVYFDKKGDYK